MFKVNSKNNGTTSSIIDAPHGPKYASAYFLKFQLQAQENELRKQRGEAPLPEEDINKVFRPLQPPPRLENLLTSAQIETYCDQLNQFASQSFGKLFMAEKVQRLEEL